MRKIRQKEFDELVELHEMWLKNRSEGVQLILNNVNIINVVIKNKNLSYSEFHNSKFNSSKFYYSIFHNSEFRNSKYNESEKEDFRLNYCKGATNLFKSIQLEKYDVVFTANVIHIGCVTKYINELWNMSYEQISKLDEDALEWWDKYKDPLKSIMIASGVDQSKFKKQKSNKIVSNYTTHGKDYKKSFRKHHTL